MRITIVHCTLLASVLATPVVNSARVPIDLTVPGDIWRDTDKVPVLSTEGKVDTKTVEQGLVQHPLDIHQSATMAFEATCEITGNVDSVLAMTIRYDGKRVYYKSERNVDKFEAFTSGGGGRFPVTSTAHYTHTNCRAIDPNTFCSFTFVSTAKASIRVNGPHPGIEIGTTQAGEGGPSKEGHVVETCVPMSTLPKGKDSPCLSPTSKTSKRCYMNTIAVYPYLWKK